MECRIVFRLNAMAKNATIEKPIPASYLERSRRPLPALMFLLPLIILYELGVALVASHDITARGYILQFLFGLGLGNLAYYVPGVAVLLILLGMHLYQRGPWRVEPGTYTAMWIESVMLSLPILAIAMLTNRALAQAVDGSTVPTEWWENLILSLGAGIYEELVFRLLGIAVIYALLVKGLALPKYVGETVAVLGTAVLFSVYHFSESNPFEWRKFMFYTLAGIYLAAIYFYRGFGIAVGSHASYNVLVSVIDLVRQSNESG